ncbi:LAMI_0C02476g1_1 [Lachancea mirantina]|uniref:LAMI_0C02476g1_1 n=1 Tax=Lachancea mirantina TaxID=1230905 RepID=A0A1G4J187_9SACH|nr:LAMI_0C02476g1_1 [Lachancea mirantina]
MLKQISLRILRFQSIMVRPMKRSKIMDSMGSSIENNAIEKLSHVALSEEQVNLKNDALKFVEDRLENYDGKPSMFVIQGDAGTGKSVILNVLFNEIQRRAKSNDCMNDVLTDTDNFLVVNHPEMLKLYHRISKPFPYISKSALERPTSLINRLEKSKLKADVVIVDEAHLLATSKDAFKRFYGENHLQELMKLAKVLLVVYDDKQSLRMGSYWDENTSDGSTLSGFFEILPTENKQWRNLQQQFRVVAENDTLEWIEALSTEGRILDFPKSVRSGKSSFDFRIWDDCSEMYSALRELNGKIGQCRMLATYDFPYRLDGKDYFVTCGDNFKVRWDRYAPRAVLPWSERPDTFEEVGSVYTIQGFDLNYAGVILGRCVDYDSETDSIKLIPSLYDDHAGFTKKKNINEVNDVKEKIIMNSINVLLTRGVKGLYIYAYNPNLRRRLRECVEKSL